MKRITLGWILFALVNVSFSQEIQWASQVIDVSSEYSKTEFSAPQALGEPDAMWIGTKRSNAWLASDISKEEFIIVGFESPVKANQLVIAEAENPGAIKSIYVYDSGYYEYTHLELEPGWVEDGSRFFHQNFEETTFNVHAIKIILDVEAVPGRNTIDAVGVANSDEPIVNFLNDNPMLDFRNFRTEKMDESVNSEFEENNPILSEDGQTLYFSRQFSPENVGGASDPEDIWFSKRIPGTDKWTKAENIGAPWNTSGPNFICSITNINGVDHFLLGNRYEENGKMDEGVSIATLQNGVFGTPETIPIQDEYNYSYLTDYYLVNETTLLLSADRDDSYGKRDVYVTTKIGELWSAPKNLGKVINTFEDEGSPQMDQSGELLYFSSKGFNGFGGFDVYVSRRLDDTWENWSEPLNLGVNVNGGGDESYFSISKDELDKFYSRGDTLQPADIYHIQLRPTTVLVSGNVKENESQNVLKGALVSFKNEAGNEFFTVSDASGNYEAYVPSDDSWTVTAFMEDYVLVSSENVTLELNQAGTVNTLYLKKDPATFGTYVPARKVESLEVLFDVNSSYLRGQHYSELQNMAKYLMENSQLRIEIQGHTDSRASNEYNVWLSNRRAQRVADYFLNYGVGSDRVKLLALGESNLVNDCGDDADCSGAQHQRNRRTVVSVID